MTLKCRLPYRVPGTLLLLGTLLTLLASACQSPATPVGSVPTDTLAPIPSLTPRFTATPVSSNTPLPTFTYTPSITPIPPTASNTYTPTPTPVITGIVASLQTVNVRSGPGETYPAFVALPPGTGVTVLGRNPDGTWYNVRLEDGQEGWISARLLRVAEPPTPFPTATPSPDMTALALGTPLPTAVLGGGTVTPTPPAAAVTPTPPGSTAGGAPDALTPTAAAQLPVIDVGAINQTATALSGLALSLGSVTATFTPFVVATPAGGSTVPAGSTPGATSAPPPPGGAQVRRGVDVLAYCTEFRIPPPNDLAAGSSMDVYWGWYATTPELVQQHVDAVIYEVRVNGVLLNNWRSGQTTPRLESDGNYHIYWFVPVELPTPGDYQITYRASWNVQISDGYDTFGPGTRNPVLAGGCTVTVR